MKYLCFLFIALALFTSGCAEECAVMPPASDNVVVSSVVAGHVYDVLSGDRVGGARVSVEGSETSTFTTTSGEFSFASLAPGQYIFSIQKDDLGCTRSQAIMIGPSDSIYTALALMPVAGFWSLTIRWDGFNQAQSTFYLNRDGTLDWNLDQPVKGTWSLTGDSIAIDFANGTILDGVVRDSISGLVDQRDYPINGAFVARR